MSIDQKDIGWTLVKVVLIINYQKVSERISVLQLRLKDEEYSIQIADESTNNEYKKGRKKKRTYLLSVINVAPTTTDQEEILQN